MNQRPIYTVASYLLIYAAFAFLAWYIATSHAI